MARATRPELDGSPAAAQPGARGDDASVGPDDVLDGMFGDGPQQADDEDGAQLELDQQQADEIRQIVMTTLPQYLLPIEQMLAQLFESYDEELRTALLTTVESVTEAIRRIGVQDAAEPLRRLEAAVHALDAGSAGDVDVQSSMWGMLEDVKRVAQGDAGAPAEPVMTIIEACRDLDGVDGRVIEKMTAAGLVTLDQLLTADLVDVVAVTGLDRALVGRLLHAVRHRFAGGPPPSGGAALTPEDHDVEPGSAVVPETTASTPPAVKEGPAARGAPMARPMARPMVAEAAPGAAKVEADLDRVLQEQVQAEAEVDAHRARVLKARIQLAERRAELERSHEETVELRRRLAGIRETLAARLARVSELRAERTAAQRRLDAASRAADEAEQRVAQLKHERAASVPDYETLSTSLSALKLRVAALVRGGGGD